MSMSQSITPPTDQSLFSNVERTLGYLGLLPFVYIALGLPLPDGLVPLQVFVTYSAIILAFMAGCLWRYSIATSILSNLLAIAAFASLLLPLKAQLMLLPLAGLYLVLLGWEGHYCRKVYPQGYWSLRCQLTAVVVACHLIVFSRVVL